MAIENFDEVKTYFEANKDNEDVKGFVNGFTSLDVFKNKITSDADFKSFMDSTKDQHATKHLSTWQQNNLKGLVDAKVKELYPDIDPKDKALAEMKAEFEAMKQATAREKITNSALKLAGDKQLPLELIDFMVGDSEEVTNSNIAKLEAVFASTVNKMVEEKLRGKTPSGGGGSGNSEIDTLEIERQAALKASNMPLAISIKNKIVALQNKK